MKSSDDKISEALAKLRQICSRQEKCPADIISLLKKWDVEQSQHTKITDRLKSEHFIDEQRYTAAYVRDKIKFDHWGFIKIRIMLQQKGISRAVIDDAFSIVDKEEYKTMIRRELEKKRKTLKGTAFEIGVKLARYGSGRGYEMEFMRAFLGEGIDD